MQELREAVEDLVAAAIVLPDEAMDLPYAWGEYDEDGLRFALLTAYHQLRDLAFAVQDGRPPPTLAQRILGGFVQAYADLDGLLAGVSDAEIDAPPGGEDWPLREVLYHVLRSDSGFTGSIRLGLDEVQAGRASRKLTSEDFGSFRPKALPQGGGEAMRAAMKASRDRAISEFGGLSDADLEVRTYFWEDEPLPLRFRLMRYELHWRQHIVQADKTMATIGHPPTEAERLCRLISRALGDLEGALLGVPQGFAAEGVRRVAALVREHETSVRAIGGAGR